jgi:hypothetical protein
MPRAFFDIIGDGEIAIYPAEQFAVFAVDGDEHWHAKNFALPFPHAPTGASKALIPFGDFHPANKLQKFLRQRFGEIRLDGTYVIPFRPFGRGGTLAQFSLAGIVFFPDGNWSRGFHHEGSPKELANLAFRVIHSSKNAKHPVVIAARESFREKETNKAPPTPQQLADMEALKAHFAGLGQ